MKNEIDIDKKTLANLSSMVDGKTIATDDFLALLRNPAAMEELNARLRLRNILGPGNGGELNDSDRRDS